MEVIKTVHDLPEWFCIDRYRVYAAFPETDLISELEARLSILEEIPSYESSSDAMRSYEEEYEDIKRVGVICPEPEVIDYLDGSLNIDLQELQQLLSKRTKQRSRGVGSVWPMTIRDAYYMGEFAASNEFVRIGTDGRLEPNSAAYDLNISTEYGRGDAVFDDYSVTIDLRNPDELILSDLKKLLPELRKEMGVDSFDGVFKQSTAKKVLENRLFPYMDLKIWESLEDKKITNSVLAAAIFPEGSIDGSKGEYFIRTTVKSLFNRVSKPGFVESWRYRIKE